MAASEQKLIVVEQEILARIDEEALAKAVRCYPILYDKSMKEFKDQKRKENAWKKVADSVAGIKKKTTTLSQLRQVSPAPLCNVTVYLGKSQVTHDGAREQLLARDVVVFQSIKRQDKMNKMRVFYAFRRANFITHLLLLQG